MIISLDDFQYNKFLRQIEMWNRNEEFEKIIDALTEMSSEQRGYELNMILSGAYVNMEKYAEALEVLDSVVDEGSADPEYFFSVGYANYYNGNYDEALVAFERAHELSPFDVETLLFLCFCTGEDGREDLFEEYSHRLEKLDKSLYNSYFNSQAVIKEGYTDEEIGCIELFIESKLGEYNNVLHDVSAANIACDILLIPPTDERDYYTLVTCGMGAHRMKVPEEFRDKELERAELMLCLPSNWHVKSTSEKWFWPIKMMKMLANLPINEDSWLGVGHTVSNGKPCYENTLLSGVILGQSPLIDEENVCELPNGETVNFYQIIPLYEEEINYKLEYGEEALFELMGDIDPVLDINRKNFCIASRKKYKIPKSTMRKVISCGGAAGCFATDRIIVDGAKIGFMYREKPLDKKDSGWRFMAGDENEEYMNNVDKSGIYHLNTICNYDEKVIPLLGSPAGSIFVRDDNGEFVSVKNK